MGPESTNTFYDFQSKNFYTLRAQNMAAEVTEFKLEELPFTSIPTVVLQEAAILAQKWGCGRAESRVGGSCNWVHTMPHIQL